MDALGKKCCLWGPLASTEKWKMKMWDKICGIEKYFYKETTLDWSLEI